MNHTVSIQKSLRRLVSAISILLALILVSSLLMLLSSNRHYSRLLHNVTTASEFNQEFKNKEALNKSARAGSEIFCPR